MIISSPLAQKSLPLKKRAGQSLSLPQEVNRRPRLEDFICIGQSSLEEKREPIFIVLPASLPSLVGQRSC